MKKKEKEKTIYQECCEALDSGGENKIALVRKTLKNKANNNLDLLLQIKAEAMENDPFSYASIFISISACIIPVISLIYTMMQSFMGDTSLISVLASVIYLIIILGVIVLWVCVISYYSRKMEAPWRKYIIVVVDELIEESKRIDNEHK